MLSRTLLLTLLAPLVASTGCYVYYPRRTVVVAHPPETVVYTEGAPPQQEVVVDEPPPMPAVIVEDPGICPVYGWAWCGGHWAWGGGRYSWYRGHWAAPPHARATWIVGGWEHRGRGSVWIGAHWR